MTVLDNPARVTPAALNIGIRHARGAVIIILGARAVVAPDFIAESIAALVRTGADAVGGVVESRPWLGHDTATARAIALALRSPFGVGDARYRYAGREQDADTVNYGAYRRDVFDRIGLFDESLSWVEDDELNYRLRAAGGRLVVSPRIRVTYYARPSLGALWRQQFHWGRYKPLVALRWPAQMRPRHAAPTVFVTALVVAALASLVLRPARALLAAVIGAYAVACAVAVAGAARTGDRAALLRLPAAFTTMHVAYGTGMALGLARTTPALLRRLLTRDRGRR
ncbi:MAG: glycosyltransferase [Dehalococcoidia bacterium]